MRSFEKQETKEFYNQLQKKAVANMHFSLFKKYPEELIVTAFKQVKTERLELYAIEKETLVKTQGFVTPQDQENLDELVDEAQVWQKVQGRLQKLYKEPVEEEHKEVDLEDVKKRSEAIKKVYNLDEQWSAVFNNYSFENEFLGQILFYVMLSLLAKKKESHLHLGNRASAILHAIVIQTSGSGKDRSIEFLLEMIKLINGIHKAKHLTPLLSFYTIGGSDTYEAFIDSYELTSKGDLVKGEDGEPIITPGILSSNDLIVSTEASFLLQDSGKASGKSLRELFLQVLEGKPHRKTLRGWKGRSTTTTCNANFVGISRPFGNMQEHMVNTGLQQRALNYMRNIDQNTRDKMDYKVLQSMYLDSDKEAQLHKEMQALAQQIYKFYEFFQKTTFIYEQNNERLELVYNKFKEFGETMNEQLINPVHRDLMMTFRARFSSLIAVIGIFNAGIRKSNKVQLVDTERALDFVEESYNSILDWVGQTIDIDERAARKYKEHERVFKEVLQTMPLIVPKQTVMQEVMKVLGCSLQTAYKIYNVVNSDNRYCTEETGDKNRKILKTNPEIFKKKQKV